MLGYPSKMICFPLPPPHESGLVSRGKGNENMSDLIYSIQCSNMVIRILMSM